MTTRDKTGSVHPDDVAERLDILYRDFRDDIQFLFSNRVIEALTRLDGPRLEQFIALNVPQLILDDASLQAHANTFRQRFIARCLQGTTHLAKGIADALNGVTVIRDTGGYIVSCSSRTLSQKRCTQILAALRALLWQFDAAGGEALGLSSSAFGFPPSPRGPDPEQSGEPSG